MDLIFGNLQGNIKNTKRRDKKTFLQNQRKDGNMVSSVVSLKVFVASPSDASDERQTLEQVINKINKMLGERQGLRFDLVKWETDTYPSMGLDAQSVINEQIGDDYDVFIGVLWKRLGTPTKKAKSGTVEEFYRAYDRALKEPKKIRVMFYFNDSAISPSELDLDQYKQIVEFRKSIGEQGVYYWTYKQPEDFERFVEMHLSKVMNDFLENKWGQAIEAKEKVEGVTTELQAPLSLDMQTDIETEDGFLDLIISSLENMNSATELISRIVSLTEELTQKTGENTAEIENLPKPINPNKARLVVNRQADTWNEFAQRVEVELPILSTKFRLGIQSYAKSAQLLEDFTNTDKKQVIDALEAIRKLKSNVISAEETIVKLRAAIESVPRMSVMLNHAKRYVLNVLDKMIEEYRAEISLATEAEKIIKDVLEKFV